MHCAGSDNEAEEDAVLESDPTEQFRDLLLAIEAGEAGGDIMGSENPAQRTTLLAEEGTHIRNRYMHIFRIHQCYPPATHEEYLATNSKRNHDNLVSYTSRHHIYKTYVIWMRM